MSAICFDKGWLSLWEEAAMDQLPGTASCVSAQIGTEATGRNFVLLTLRG